MTKCLHPLSARAGRKAGFILSAPLNLTAEADKVTHLSKRTERQVEGNGKDATVETLRLSPRPPPWRHAPRVASSSPCHNGAPSGAGRGPIHPRYPESPLPQPSALPRDFHSFSNDNCMRPMTTVIS